MKPKLLIGAGILVLLAGGVWLMKSRTGNQSAENIPEPGASLSDVHGLAIDRNDSSRIYIATHTGLLALQNDTELTQVSDARDDFMGFTAHPTDASTLYSSGHGSRSGSLGFQRSTDGGKSWQKVSDGISGPVDFHALAVSQASADIVYGYFRGQLQRSDDEGKTWKLASDSLQNVLVLATSPTAKDTVYAGTANGLFVSRDRGTNWSTLNLSGIIIALASNPENDRELMAYSQTLGLSVSRDGGNTWEKLDSQGDSMVMQLAYDPQNPTTLYLINRNLEIHKSTDSGMSWRMVM